MRTLVKDIIRRLLGAGGLDDVKRDLRTTQVQMATMLQEVTKLVVETKAGVSASQGQLGETHSLVLRLAGELPDELLKTKSGVSHVEHALGEMQSHTVALRQELAALLSDTVPLVRELSSRQTDASMAPLPAGAALSPVEELKGLDHEAAMARMARLKSPPPPSPEPVATPSLPPWPVAPAGLLPFAAEAEFAAFRRALPQSVDLPDRRILALFSAVQYLVARQIAGDVIDCTHAGDSVLTVLGAAFVLLKDTSRRLIICDPTANPHHRAEYTLEPWGNDFDLLGAKLRPAKSQRGEPPSAAIRRTGYPQDKLLVWRYPREPIATTTPVAFLGVTSETYPANRWAIAAFVDRLSDGGILAVDRITQRDGVAEHLTAQRMAMSPVEVADGYRMGIRQRA
jgi:hypothetical protein